MRNRAATWANLVFASIVVVGVFVQAYLIASYAMGAGEEALDAHGFVGGLVVHGLFVLVWAAYIAWRDWRFLAASTAPAAPPPAV